MENVISKGLIEKGYTFQKYLDLIEDLLSKNETTGSDQSPDRVEKTRLNFHRLKRIYKTSVIDEQLKSLIKNIDEPLTWIILVEAWCGDGAQIAPYFAILSELNSNIVFRLVLRDENPQLMNKFLTDGKSSIPKFICLDGNQCVLSSWGPRPAEAQKIFIEYKNNPLMTKDEFHKELHLWYARNKGEAIMNEIYELFLHCCENSKSELIF